MPRSQVSSRLPFLEAHGHFPSTNGVRDTYVSEGMANMPESREEAEDQQSGEKALGSCVAHPAHPLMMGQVAEKHEYGEDK